MQQQKIEKIIIEIALEIASEKKGALFVIGNNFAYKRMMKLEISPLNVLDTANKRIIKNLATMDGACLINRQGYLHECGVMIKSSAVLKGYGTRHIAGLSASKDKNIAILASEEDAKVRIFRDGKLVLQLDSLVKNKKESVHAAIGVLEAVGAGAITTIGAVTLIPAFAISFIPGVLIFGTSYYAVRNVVEYFTNPDRVERVA